MLDAPGQNPHSNATLKIKGCCDRCALSKVKCDRQRPVCGRCITIGLDLGIAPPCNYSVSLRTLKKTCGSAKTSRRTSYSQKASSARTPTELESPSKDLQGAQQSYFANALGQNHGFERISALDASSNSAYDAPLWEDFSNDMLIDGMDSNNTTPGLDDQFLNAYFSYGLLRPQCQDMPYYSERQGSNASSNSADSLFSPDSGSASCASSSFPVNPMDLLGPEPGSLFNSDSRPCCSARIIDVVQAIWKVSKRNACSSPSQPQVTTLDQALLLCRKALESIASIWNCPCAEQPGSEFSSAFIIHAALSFFRGIIQGILGTASAQSSGMMTFETPIQMGVYTMDAEDEQRFKLQLVRNELSKISRIVEEFSKRFCHSETTDYLGQVQPSDMLKRCLNMELDVCKAMLDSH